MTPFQDDLWLDTGPTRILGMRLTATMAALRLTGDALLIYSPLPLTPARRAAVERLGVVRHLYAPNLYHHLWIGDWAEAFPEARLHGPRGLGEKRPDLRVDRVHAETDEPAFTDVVDEVPIDGLRLGETVLVHRPSGTLIVADLVHNVGRPTHRWTAVYTRMMGFYDRVALSRVIRWTAFSDRHAARRSIDGLLALPFDRLVVGHGTPLESGARGAIEAAYTFLPRA